MVYVTEMDVDDASFRQVVQDLTDRYGKVIAPHFQLNPWKMKSWLDMSTLLKMQEDVIQESDREKSVRFRITVNRILRMYREKLLEAVADK